MENQKNEQQKTTRGGRREGAGRKKTTSKRYGFNAPADVAGILEAVDGSKSDYIIAAIRAYATSRNP